MTDPQQERVEGIAREVRDSLVVNFTQNTTAMTRMELREQEVKRITKALTEWGDTRAREAVEASAGAIRRIQRTRGNCAGIDPETAINAIRALSPANTPATKEGK